VPDLNNPKTIQEQRTNEAAYRQLLVYGALAVLLPTDDLENNCLTALVSQIFSEMIIGNGIGGKASEPWLLWEGIMKIAEIIKSSSPESKAQERMDATDARSGDDSTHFPAIMNKRTGFGESIQKSFWLILQYAFLAFTTIRFIIITIATSSSLPTREPVKTSVKSVRSDLSQSYTSEKASHHIFSAKQPIISMKVWSLASLFLDLDARMPWVSATFAMLQWALLHGPGRVGETNGRLDK
jgi:hypothetical protein